MAHGTSDHQSARRFMPTERKWSAMPRPSGVAGRLNWPAHRAGITKEYCQIEKLANLDQIPRPHGFYVSCLPVRIKDASAGWCRAVALVADE